MLQIQLCVYQRKNVCDEHLYKHEGIARHYRAVSKIWTYVRFAMRGVGKCSLIGMSGSA